MTALTSSIGVSTRGGVALSRPRPSRSARGALGSRPDVVAQKHRLRNTGANGRGALAGDTRAAEMMGVPLYPDDLLEACAPWGNVCVVAGTHYIPIALPSILASLFLLLPLVAIAAKLQASGQEVTKSQMKIEELETELRVLKERL